MDAIEIPLPSFLQPRPRLDPDLPEQEPPASTSGPSPEQTEEHRPPISPADDLPAPPLPSLEPPAATRTRTSATGDPVAAGRVVAGLLVIVAGIAAGLLARTGRHLRQPTKQQVSEIADPIGRIAARHLPSEFIGRDLADVTEAAAATHAYVLDDYAGPLVQRAASAVAYPDQES